MIFCPLSGIVDQDFRFIQGFYSNPGKHYTSLYGMKGHGGYDLAPMVPGTKGIVVYATQDGITTHKDFGNTGYGKHVEILDTCGGRLSILGHLERFYPIPVDGKIKQGDPIGIMGSTGDSTNVHVHFTFKHVDQNGNILDANNGYGGGVPCAQFIRLWVNQVLGPQGV